MAQTALLIGLLVGWLQPEHFPPWLAFHNEAPVFIGLLVALLSLLLLHRPKLRVGWGGLSLVALAGCALIQLLLISDLYVGDVAIAFAYLGGAAWAWILGYHWRLSAAPAGSYSRGLLWAVLVAAIASSAIAWMQWFNLEELWFPWVMAANHTPRSLGNLAQPNQLSTLLLMGVIAAAILYEETALGRLTTALVATLVSSAVILTQSRTGLLIVLLLSAWVFIRRNTLQHLSWKTVTFWAICFVTATAMFHGKIIERSDEEKLPLGSSMSEIGGRPVLWAQFGSAVLQEKWFGYGWLRTATAQQIGALERPGQEQASYTHNHLLDLAVWFGVPLTTLFVVWAAWASWRRFSGNAENRELNLLVMWLLPLAIHSMLELPLAYAYFLFPAAMILGNLDAATQRPVSMTWQVPGWLLNTMVSLYAVLVLSIGFEYIKIEEDFRVARFENRNIGATPQDYEEPNLVIMTQFGEVLKAMRLRAEPDMSEKDLQLLIRASKRYSWAALHFRTALALGLNGYSEASAKQMLIIKQLYGAEIYRQGKEDFLAMREKYPQLNEVLLP